MNTRIYFDYNATTPMKPAVRDTMLNALSQVGNASSIHSFGRTARKTVEDARVAVGVLVGAHAKQVIFNAGATEGNNTILRGFPGRILVTATEHASVITPARALGADLIPVDGNGLVDLTAFEQMLKNGAMPSLVSVMLVNNETGVIQPVADIARLAHAAGAVVHCDAVQAAGKIAIDMNALGVDFITLSAHKIGGPQGVGALITSDGTTLCIPAPVLLTGGGQERGSRAGTENVAGIAGFGTAATLAQDGLHDFANLQAKRDQLEHILRTSNTNIRIYGADAPRVANTITFSVPGVASETLLMNLDLGGVAASSGSACSSGTVKPSHVLMAMNVPEADARCALRLSIGWDTSADDIEKFADIWTTIMKRVVK